MNSMLRCIPLATMVAVALIALFGALTYAALYPPFVGAQTESSDATLSALTVNDGTSDVALNPGFTSAGTSYRTAVKHRGERLTVTATTNDTNATDTPGVTVFPTTLTVTEGTRLEPATRWSSIPSRRRV